MKKSLMLLALIALIPAVVDAQVDMLGKTDTVYADVARIDDYHWSITVSMTNDEAIVGLSLPFKMQAGNTKIVGDSAIYTGGRVEHFTYKGFRADTAVQCVMMGLVANMGPTDKRLDPGTGRLVTLFVSSIDKEPIKQLIIDTATVYPQNSLMAVAGAIQAAGDDSVPDTIPGDNRKIRQIIPAFVVRYAK
ncbi:MAG: hypothetical protein ACE5FH_07565 [Candidatus Zixiibacteriota bacterium]